MILLFPCKWRLQMPFSGPQNGTSIDSVFFTQPSRHRAHMVQPYLPGRANVYPTD